MIQLDKKDMENISVREWGERGKGYRLRDNPLIKGMKAIHMLAAIGWGGGAFGMQALHVLHRITLDPAKREMVAYCSWFVDTWVVMPGLFGCILTGLFYSIYTSIGFFKFAWIIYKWLVTANACFWGLLFWSGLGDRLISMVHPWGLDGILIIIRGCILPEDLWAIVLQTLIIFSMCLISVYKPLHFWPRPRNHG